MQNEIIFLSLEDILQIHLDTIENDGGRPGVRDMALIESAIAAPQAAFGGEYLHQDVTAMTGALMFALISNHGFVDGNKRVGTLAALVFREVNAQLKMPPALEFEAFVMTVASGDREREQLTHWWRKWES